MLLLQGVTYIHPNGDILISDVNLAVNKRDKIALIGNNGTGKSTVLRMLAGMVQPTNGIMRSEAQSYYVPQVTGQFNDHTVAEALQIDAKLNALHEILDGNLTEENQATLDNDWSLEERCIDAFSHWNIPDVDLNEKLGSLSGGQKTKVFLAGIKIHQPEIVLLDEPSNHLDKESREILYDYIVSTKDTLVVVSHDRALLNLFNVVCELDRSGITVYGGNYEFYETQKAIKLNALHEELKEKEKALRKAKEIQIESSERQQKLNARGKKKQEKAGMPTIMMNTLMNNAEKSTAKLKDVHADKVNNVSKELHDLRKEIPDDGKMKLDLNNSSLHSGKTLFKAEDINFAYEETMLWNHPLSFQIRSGDRIVIRGHNGSGKTTLVKLILGELTPATGTLDRAAVSAIYIDQDYSLIDNRLTVYEQAQMYNPSGMPEHEVKIRLNRFRFGKDDWNKPCSPLSGGEKMRLILCSLSIRTQAPDVIILDEPTNNLDLQNIKILTTAIREYEGTLIVISHDEYFLMEVGVKESVHIDQ